MAGRAVLRLLARQRAFYGEFSSPGAIGVRCPNYSLRHSAACCGRCARLPGLERGVSQCPHRDTARRLAAALGLSGDELARFEDAARGRRSATGAVAPGSPPAGIAAATRTVPRQLPAHARHFAGRADDLAALTGLLDKAVGASRPAAGTTMIAAIGGTAGIGKTELAVRWAHQAADRFPDGHLYVNLRGFDPAAPPVRPAEVIRDFLGALGVDPSGISVSLDAQAALYRSLLAGRRFLLLLDNARDAEQVRPLLPGTETCLVLVTSRRQLSSLAAREGAHHHRGPRAANPPSRPVKGLA
jgi:hypothetical protein